MPNKETIGQRNIGLDFLRVVSMIMIVMLHYLGKGGLVEEQNSSNIYNI